MPRELWLLIDHLYRNGLKTRELFESIALHEEIIRIRDWLDSGSLDPIRILFLNFLTMLYFKLDLLWVLKENCKVMYEIKFLRFITCSICVAHKIL